MQGGYSKFDGVGVANLKEWEWVQAWVLADDERRTVVWGSGFSAVCLPSKQIQLLFSNNKILTKTKLIV